MEQTDSKTLTAPPTTQQEPPDHKRLKMSSTTSDDEEDATAATAAGDSNTTTDTKKQRYKRRKIAIFLAYCGVGYQGMQKNPGARTIEGDLEEALFQSGAVPEQDRGIPKRYDWARSARTDKGVSAVGQVVSGRFYIDPAGLVDRLNSNLLPSIRIFGYKRVTASFNAKKFCDRRRYVYLLPVFALDPCVHRDRESVLASNNELVKCLECSERGRKVDGKGRGFEFESKSNLYAEMDNGRSNNITNSTEYIEEAADEEEQEEDTSSVVVTESKEEVDHDDKRSRDTMEEVLKDTMEEDQINGGMEKGIKGSGFHYGEVEKERFNRILKYYVGSHNFHNFTTRTKAEDPSARRYIVSFDARTTVLIDGIEFIKCEVVGQSFMLHQIRKMIGLAVAIMRNCAPESLIETALKKDFRINLPTAPEVGLYLEECLFVSYNQKWKDSHEEISMKAYAEEAEDFKMKHIYPHIASTEHKEGVVALWLHSLNHRNYPDLRVDDNRNTNGTNNS
uniref:tRNA pseudouridine synthase n=1 Tax=Rhizophora mucronata TaxID=61149 RepID=A0A2P2PIA8_RHIMU